VVSDDIRVKHHGFPNDDIVTTLRTMVQFTNAVAGGVCWRAADEIERLRKERNYYEEMASHIAGKNFDANEEIHRLKIELKAVRGE
jgi:hypothetical protein